jgi:MFS family permease
MPLPLEARLRRALDVASGLPRPFWVLWSGMLVNRAGSFVVPFLAIYLTQARGFSAAQAGVVAASYGAGALFASPLGGYLADHAGRRATLIGALALGGLGMIALGFARDLAVIIPACFLVAMVGESYRPAMQAAVADLVPPADRPRAFGLVYWVINLGFSIGLTLGGVLASASFLWLFVGDGLTSIAFAFIVWLAVHETRPEHAGGGSRPRPQGFVGGFLAPYRDRPFALFVLLSALVLLVFMQHFAALPLDMAAHGMSRAALGAVLALNGILIVFVQPFVSPFLARLNRSHAIAGGAALVGLGFGLNALANGVPLFTLGVIIWSLGEIAVLPIANAIVADVALPEMRGRYQGAYGLTFGLAAFAAPLIGTSVLQRWGASALWLGCLALGLIVAAGHLALAPALTRLREERSGAR